MVLWLIFLFPFGSIYAFVLLLVICVCVYLQILSFLLCFFSFYFHARSSGVGIGLGRFMSNQYACTAKLLVAMYHYRDRAIAWIRGYGGWQWMGKVNKSTK